MKILLTNDDSINAEGIQALESTLLYSGWQVTVVAPAEVMSMCGHRITTETPLRVTCHDDRHFAVHGTPADCVRLGLTELCAQPPDWVISGINHGGNLGADIVVSGTVAAVREGAYAGVHGIALSHYKKHGQDFDWAFAADCALTTIQTLMTDHTLRSGEYWNVNLPHIATKNGIPDQVHCEPSKQALPVAFVNQQAIGAGRVFMYSGVYADRHREPGSDIDVCFNGKIAVSKLTL